MGSSYTDNIGIEKPDTGDQSGTWGETTNLNFDIIDRAISGVARIQLTGTSKTLTTTNGALSEGGNRVLVFFGTPGGTCTITIDPADQDKFYVVFNDTNESITLTQGSGGNVTILTGNTKIIYADGAGSTAKVSEVGATMPVGGASVAELGHLSGVTSAIQTQLNTLTTNLAAFLPTGTRMLFQQTAAPTGFTKETSNFDNHAIRVVTGNTGSSSGGESFTDLFTGVYAGTVSSSISGDTGAVQLSISQIPAHRHKLFSNNNAGPGVNSNIGSGSDVAKSAGAGGGSVDEKYAMRVGSAQASVGRSELVGGGGSHSHTAGSLAVSSSFTGTKSLALNYVDVIIGIKS